MKSSPSSRDPAVEKLLADVGATSPEGSSPAQHDPALLKALAEASAWIVTLHGPERTAGVESGFQRWLAESPTHRYAFEHATETWNSTRASVRRSAQVDVSVPDKRNEQPRWRRARAVAALAASLLIGAVGVLIFVQQSGLQTAVGERRTMVLDDGTQVTLNTATRLSVDYDKHRRHVRLEAGEAHFEVARRPAWPFVVTVGDREVTALGTSFLVRRDSVRIAVTLLEGKVRVTSMAVAARSSSGTTTTGEPVASMPGAATRGQPASRDVGQFQGIQTAARDAERAAEARSITLAPGERVVFESHAAPVLDRPELQKLTAWQQGLVNIDELTLAQAIEEMNRYSTLQLAVEGPAAEIRVSGVFRITDSENLAQAVAMTHGLDLRREGRRLVLSGTPQPPSEARFGPARDERAHAP